MLIFEGFIWRNSLNRILCKRETFLSGRALCLFFIFVSLSLALVGELLVLIRVLPYEGIGMRIHLWLFLLFLVFAIKSPSL